MEQSDVKDVKENKPDFNLKLVFLVEIIDFDGQIIVWGKKSQFYSFIYFYNTMDLWIKAF